MACMFCEIVQRRAGTTLVYQDDRVTAFRDLHPRAPTHLLIVPNEHIQSLAELEDDSLAGHLLNVTRQLADELKLERGYRVVTNVGPDAGQSVFHLHFHLLGGR